jgi:serine/threonine protein kinase
MLSGKLPFSGSAAELMYQHQHVEPPIEKLRNTSVPVISLIEVLFAKDPDQRFQSPAQLQQALIKVRGAVPTQKRGARCRVRTCDFLRVKQALYH